jgi:hypothetical protein
MVYIISKSFLACGTKTLSSKTEVNMLKNIKLFSSINTRFAAHSFCHSLLTFRA